MKRQQSLVLFASVLSLLATNAWSDGVVQPAEQPCCGSGAFAGPYIGASVGYGSQKVEVDNLTLGTKFTDEEGAAVFGGYAGYNWQRCCDPLVLGIEADLSYLNASPTALDIETGPTGLNETTSLNSKMDWFGTLRARVGHVVHEDFLLYATGGLAFARLTHTLRDNCVGCGNSPFNLGPFAQSDKDTKVGWTAGGGAEYVHDTHWLFRAETLYVDLGSDSHTYVVTTPVGTGISETKWHDQFWMGRLGIAYKFDAP